MKLGKTLVFLITGFLSFFGTAHAIDIPLNGGGGAGGGGQKIGYIDMERIFQIYPQTKYAKEDYAKRLQKKREAISEKEEELQNLKSRISVLEATFQDIQHRDANDNNTEQGSASDEEKMLSSNPESLVQMKVELENKRQELEEQKKQAVEEMAAFEKQQSQIILGKIYQALKDLAIEEQVSLVVDKSSILYGSAEVDLTEKLQQRVRGY